MKISKRILIVNADDLGYSSSRNDGIFDAYSNGLVSSASLLVNGIAAKDAAIRALAIGLPLGLHLNLTEGICLANPTKSSLMIKGEMRGKMGLRSALAIGGIDEKDIESEIQEQINQFRALMEGRDPTHVDGHQHCHILPSTREVFCRVLIRNGINRSRLPIEWPLSIHTAGNKEFLEQVYFDAVASQHIFTKSGISFPSHFIGLALSHAANVERVWTSLMTIPKKRNEDVVCEWMCHPSAASHAHEVAGFLPSCRPDEFALSMNRVNELEILKSDMMKQVAITSECFELGSFLDIPSPATNCADYGNSKKPRLIQQPRLHCCIVTSATAWTGNLSTAIRIRNALSEEFDASIVDANAFNTDVAIEAGHVSSRAINISNLPDDENFSMKSQQVEWKRFVDFRSKHDPVNVALGIHALRAGRLLLATSETIPFAIVLGGTDVNQPWSEHERGTMRNALFKASRVIAFNEEMLDRATSITASVKSKSVVIPQSVDVSDRDIHFNLTSLTKRTGKPLLLLPLGVRAVKDPLYLIEAVKKDLPEAILVILGPVLDTKLGDKLISECNQNVVFIGPLARPQLLQAISQSDYVLNTSVSEGMSNTLLETMAMGGPALVLARRNEGNCALVKSSHNGFLYDSPESFVSLIKCLETKRPEWKQRIALNAKLLVSQQFSFEAEAQGYIEVLHQTGHSTHDTKLITQE